MLRTRGTGPRLFLCETTKTMRRFGDGSDAFRPSKQHRKDVRSSGTFRRTLISLLVSSFRCNLFQDVLVNNAGIFTEYKDYISPAGGPGASISKHPTADWDRQVGINQTGVYLGIKHGSGSMERNKAPEGKSIINFSSLGSLKARFVDLPFLTLVSIAGFMGAGPITYVSHIRYRALQQTYIMYGFADRNEMGRPRNHKTRSPLPRPERNPLQFDPPWHIPHRHPKRFAVRCQTNSGEDREE